MYFRGVFEVKGGGFSGTRTYDTILFQLSSKLINCPKIALI